MGGKDSSKGRLETATISDISYLFVQGKLIIIRSSQGHVRKLSKATKL